MDSVPDTLREAPNPGTDPDAPSPPLTDGKIPLGGRLLPTVVLLACGFTAAVLGLEIAADIHLLRSDALATMTRARLAGENPEMPAGQLARAAPAMIELQRRWLPPALAADLPYLLACVAGLAFALAVLARGQDAARSWMVRALAVAALARVGVSAVSYGLATESVAVMVAAITEKPTDLPDSASIEERAAAARAAPQIAQAGDATSTVAGAMVLLTGGGVAAFWAFLAFLASRRVQPPGSPDDTMRKFLFNR